jgi:hypothetical protein
LSLALMAVCSAPLALLWQVWIAPPEVRPPYPRAQLLSTVSTWGSGSMRVIRNYHVDGSMRDVIDWYRGEGGGASARVSESLTRRCSQNRITAQRPRSVLARWTPVLTMDVRYCPAGDGVQVTTVSYYRRLGD